MRGKEDQRICLEESGSDIWGILESVRGDHQEKKAEVLRTSYEEFSALLVRGRTEGNEKKN